VFAVVELLVGFCILGGGVEASNLISCDSTFSGPVVWGCGDDDVQLWQRAVLLELRIVNLIYADVGFRRL